MIKSHFVGNSIDPAEMSYYAVFYLHRGLTQSQCGVILYESCQGCFMKGLQVLYDFLNQYKVGDGKLH